ncbi:MAG: hypothetical protein II698_06550 [Ruminococcus sp.]|nr:hypothetical protein [Ruminococcus sp.]
MDTLIEQVVPKSKNAGYGVKIALIILIAIAIPATFVIIAKITGIAYLAVIGMFLLLFTAYGAWYFITSLKVEYEYSFLSSTLRIDKIIAKRRRRAIVKVDVRKFDDFFPYSDKEMNSHKFNKVYRASTKEFSEENYVAAYHDEAKGKCAILFTPNDKLLAEMKPYFNNELRKKLFVNKQL